MHCFCCVCQGFGTALCLPPHWPFARALLPSLRRFTSAEQHATLMSFSRCLTSYAGDGDGSGAAAAEVPEDTCYDGDSTDGGGSGAGAGQLPVPPLSREQSAEVLSEDVETVRAIGLAKLAVKE